MQFNIQLLFWKVFLILLTNNSGFHHKFKKKRLFYDFFNTNSTCLFVLQTFALCLEILIYSHKKQSEL